MLKRQIPGEKKERALNKELNAGKEQTKCIILLSSHVSRRASLAYASSDINWYAKQCSS
jgi:hypothetical protein